MYKYIIYRLYLYILYLLYLYIYTYIIIICTLIRICKNDILIFCG